MSHSKPLLILDLDETLVYASEKRPDTTQADFELYDYKVSKRPFLNHFLNEIKHYYQIAVWSSASDDYVAEVVLHIFPANYPLLFVWGRSKATQKLDISQMDIDSYFNYFNHLHYIKRLSKVKRKFNIPLEQMLIVDDTPFKSQYNYGNAVYPSEYNGNPNDDELKLLLKYLVSISNKENFRSFEKRFWKGEV